MENGWVLDVATGGFEPVGKGTFGNVYKVEHPNKPGTMLAVKLVRAFSHDKFVHGGEQDCH